MTMEENFEMAWQSLGIDQVIKEADIKRRAEEGRNGAAQGRLTHQWVA